MRGLPVAIAIASVLVAFRVRAQEGVPAHSPVEGLSGVDEGERHSYWEQGRPRWFFSATLELGYAYARPQLAAGRGRPHWEWVGIEGLPLVTAEGAGAYGGIRGEVPNFDARAGVRWFAPFERSLLAIQADNSYNRLDIETRDGPTARYTAYEAEISAYARLGGRIFGVLTAYYIPNIPSEFYLFEESLKVVMAPPFVWRARIGYAFELGPEDNVRVGPAAELLGLPGRDSYVVRGGIVAVAPVSATLDVQATLMPVISSPDSIGLAGADFGHLGVRWRWATGAPPR